MHAEPDAQQRKEVSAGTRTRPQDNRRQSGAGLGAPSQGRTKMLRNNLALGPGGGTSMGKGGLWRP